MPSISASCRAVSIAGSSMSLPHTLQPWSDASQRALPPTAQAVSSTAVSGPSFSPCSATWNVVWLAPTCMYSP